MGLGEADRRAVQLVQQRGWMTREQVEAAGRLCEVWGMDFLRCAEQASWLTGAQVAAVHGAVGAPPADLLLSPDPISQPPGVGARYGDYVLERRLGSGSFGMVFLARHVTSDLRHAVKLVSFSNEEQRQRFMREGETLARLNHPGVVRVHQCHVLPSGIGLLSMDAVEGRDVDAHLESGGLAQEDCLELGAQIAEALAHMHAEGVVHRDVKPANVILREAPRQAVLCDFGLVHDMHEVARLTRSRQMLGSPAFMAPEQILGERDRIGPPTDVHALGVVLFRLLTGDYPFEGDSMAALSGRILTDAPPSLRGSDPTIPRALDALVRRCLAKAPASRPTAAEVGAALRAAARGELREGPLRAIAVGLGALLVAAAALGLGWALSAPEREARTHVAEAVSFEEELAARWGLGLLDPAAAPDLAPLEAHASRAGEAAETLSGEEAQEARDLQSRLAARASLLKLEQPPASPGSTRDELMVRALLALRAGDAHEARAVAGRLRGDARRTPRAQLLDVAILGESDPRACLRRAARVEGVPRAALLRLALPALRPAYTACLGLGARTAGDAAREVGAAAEALGVTVEDHWRAKASALERGLRGVQATHDKQLEVLVEVARAEPRIKDVPGAKAAVERVLAAAPASDLEQRVALYRIGGRIGVTVPEDLADAIWRQSAGHGMHPSLEILLGCVELGFPICDDASSDRVRKWLTRDQLRELERTEPRGIAEGWLLLLRQVPFGPASWEEVDVPALTEAVEAFSARDDLDDLGHHYRGELVLLRALLRARAGATLEELRPLLRRARDLLVTDPLRLSTFEVEARALMRAGRGGEVEALLAPEIARLRERLPLPPEVFNTRDRRFTLAQALMLAAEACGPERVAEALAWLDQAAELTAGLEKAHSMQAVASRLDVLRLAGRRQEALNAIPETLWTWEVAAAACRVYLDQGLLEQAELALRGVQRRYDGGGKLYAELSEELRRARAAR